MADQQEIDRADKRREQKRLWAQENPKSFEQLERKRAYDRKRYHELKNSVKQPRKPYDREKYMKQREKSLRKEACPLCGLPYVHTYINRHIATRHNDARNEALLNKPIQTH